jgi:hypothetical protein
MQLTLECERRADSRWLAEVEPPLAPAARALTST